jgi:multidrug resistance efflux pump
VIDKKGSVGDMVTPGQILATLFDPLQMQLVASVRESLAHRLNIGQQIDVQIESLSNQCLGTISEIVPEAESRSRASRSRLLELARTACTAGCSGESWFRSTKNRF